MSPVTVRALATEVIVNDRRTIVECGAGVSTLYLAALVAPRGGRLVSIEDDPGWLDVVSRLLEQAGLARHVNLVLAPLAPCAAALDGQAWYDEAAIAEAVGDLTIDMLVVDGPTAYQPGRQRARYPAVPVFVGRLATDAVVVLDDTDRAGEKDVLERWLAHPALTAASCKQVAKATFIHRAASRTFV